jgi:hypothetical protein
MNSLCLLEVVLQRQYIYTTWGKADFHTHVHLPPSESMYCCDHTASAELSMLTFIHKYLLFVSSMTPK